MAYGHEGSAGDRSNAAARAGDLRAAASRVSAGRAGVIPPIPPPPWSREPGPRRIRADKPVLSREAIVAAAIRVIDEEGFDAVSMRRVAQEFGTGAASLYAYVANKDQLMDLIVDEIMAESAVEVREIAPDVLGWQEQLKSMLRSSYQVLLSHRDIAKAMLGRIPFGPNGLRNVEAMLKLLRAHGMPDYVAAYAGDLIGQYLVASAIEGFTWQERYPDSTPTQTSEAMSEVGDYLESLPKEEFPNVTALARVMVGDSGDPDSPLYDRFELGLDILVRGLTTFLPSSAHEQWRN
ncbi:TetR/AcrR family transcriptional regulator [Actinospica sp.]|jgi:AcrR family transcriptional regulator|uniref:TetR/AcrR family transcriptional regulator n=1 Tax=Actinospica sp. TaxID=1872142 RepID=UPI002CDBA930|nr:TetR/AcrR family transcriptional regulator [Actinospica sp.]HWG22816.1 TetR/AcrR family transcriptional regulator [Actinospica sp.]